MLVKKNFPVPTLLPKMVNAWFDSMWASLYPCHFRLPRAPFISALAYWHYVTPYADGCGIQFGSTVIAASFGNLWSSNVGWHPIWTQGWGYGFFNGRKMTNGIFHERIPGGSVDIYYNQGNWLGVTLTTDKGEKVVMKCWSLRIARYNVEVSVPSKLRGKTRGIAGSGIAGEWHKGQRPAAGSEASIDSLHGQCPQHPQFMDTGSDFNGNSPTKKINQWSDSWMTGTCDSVFTYGQGTLLPNYWKLDTWRSDNVSPNSRDAPLVGCTGDREKWRTLPPGQGITTN